MVHSGLLFALLRLLNIYGEETALVQLCIHIVANVSLFPHLHRQIFQSGITLNNKQIVNYNLKWFVCAQYRVDWYISKVF